MGEQQSRTLPILRISEGAIRANLVQLYERYESMSPAQRPVPMAVDTHDDCLGVGADLVTGIARDVGFGFDAGPVGEPPRIMMAGVLPMGAVLGVQDPSVSRPALRFSGEVLSVKDLLPGEGVSYGHLFIATEPTRVALVTGGYAQGLVRSLGNQLKVAIAGERYPIVGRVAMDVCVVNIGSADVRRGDEVVFLGDPSRNEPGITEWVAHTGMRAEELIAPMGLRARREIVA